MRGLDLLDGTPVLDIKPYIPYCDAFPTAAAGWVDELPTRGTDASDGEGLDGRAAEHAAAPDRLDYWPPPPHLMGGGETRPAGEAGGGESPAAAEPDA